MLENLGQLTHDAAARFSDKTALVTADRTLSYVELEQLTARLAGGLTDLGIGEGDRITLYAENSWRWIVSYFAALRVGAVINPINMMLTPDEVAFVVKDCGARAVIASSSKAKAIADITETTPAEELIVLDGNLPQNARAFDALIDSGTSIDDPPATSASALSTIAYTSGTTGHPKGAMLAHKSVLLNAEMTAQMHAQTEDDLVVCALPCPHVYGNVVMNSMFLKGGTLVLHAAFDAPTILQDIQKHRATMFEGVPTMYFYLLSEPTLDDYDLSSLTRCTVGGQTMPVAKMEEVEERFGCPLIELWGMTEMAGLGSTHTVGGKNRHGSIGIPLTNTQLRIGAVDNASETLPAGEVGELMAAGPHLMTAYYGNEAATKETIEPDGWLHTGDLAYADEDGYYFIVDRKKDMILTAGYNVYPAEIERVVAGHPAVAMVAVGRVQDDVKGELAKAYVVLKAGITGNADDIIAYCRDHLAAYKVPRAVQFVDDLPKTSTGKILRRELRTLDA